MARSDPLDQLLEDQRSNAALAWALTGFVALVALESVLTADLLWAGFTLTIVALALLPPIAHRQWVVMLPWEVLLLAVLPVLGRALATFALTTQFAVYFSVAAVALIVAVELDVFTAVEMPAWFAVLFVVIATMATAGVWAVVQWLSDLYLGSEFILDSAPTPEEVETRVMWDFVAATAAGIVAGVVFEWYFRRRSRTAARLHEEVVGD